MREIIGTAECLNDLCKKPVPVKKQLNSLAVMSCSWCGMLTQAHNSKADKFLRQRMTAETDTADAAGEVSAAAPVKTTPAKAAKLSGTEEVKKNTSTEEPSIFDVFTRGGKK